MKGLVSGIGSGGTLQGVAQYLLEKNPDCRIVAVEPRNVSALLGDEPGLHQIQGIGDGFIPDILDTSIITDIVEVSDEDAINTARELAKVQGLLVGTSSGANVWAAKKMAEKYGKDKVIATVLADRAEVRRILKEEHMASVCAYQLSHFLYDEDPFVTPSSSA